MSSKKIKLEPLEEPDDLEDLELPLIEGHAPRIKEKPQIDHFLPKNTQISLEIEEIHQISNALAPKSEIFGEVWTLGPSRDLRESGDDEIKEGEPRNAVARRIKRNRELRAVESKGDYVPNNYRPPPPKKRVNRPLWERQMEILELERKMPIIPAVIIPRPTPSPSTTSHRCSICFKRTETITIKGVFQLVLITGQILCGKKSIQQANIFVSDSENFVSPNTILIVLLLTLVVQSLNAAGYVEIELGGPNDPCNKYTKKGTDYLALTHVRVLEAIDNHKNRNSQLYNNIVCNLESHDDIYKYKFKCDGKKSGRTDTVYYLIVGVRATKQMLSGSIEYMYREDTMHLFENGFLDPANMKNEKFNHDRHLHIKVVKIDGLIHFDDDRKMTDCHKYFPHRLIADHGLYMMVQVDGKENLMQPMYYEPYEHEGRMEIGRANW